MSKICNVKGCNKPRHARGLCSMHSSRLQRNGVLTTVHRDKSGIAQRYPKEYKSWCHLKERCCNPNCKNYIDYGGRGIQVCGRWLEKPYGFKNFMEDMGERPGPEYSIDRINVDGDYTPENCRWATAKIQANNRRTRKDTWFYTYKGRTKTLREWSRETGIPLNKLRQRYWSKTFDKTKLLEKVDFRCKI